MLFHRLFDVNRRVDVLQLNAVDFHTPFVRGFIQDGTELHIDGISRRQALIQFQFADDISEGGLRQLLNGIGQVVDFVNRFNRIYNLKVNQSIDLCDNVVFCNHALFREVKDCFAQIDPLPHLVLGNTSAVRCVYRHAPSNITWSVDDGNDDVDSC